ncbi:uncharacterized protein LOC133332587 [Musca vetustissima]|uniref:uncharacterized protein LOC133332587 n=1 Tax=Musca vetustissima TaxID=27455 RepID=UPI002AB76F94|nr:uncharacterized protein LOC133332587 [Musca vetustissima]
MKSIETHSDNPDLVSFHDFKVERIRRGVYAASGRFIQNFDIVEGDDSEIEFLSYRSENGVRPYRPLPFRVQRQHFFSYLNSFYRLIMDTLKDCSNMPVFEDKFQPPFEKKTYILDKCQFNQEEFPQHLQEGFYKIVVNGYGAANWNLILVVQVQNEW